MSANSIVFVVNTLAQGGAEIQVLRLALGMRRRGWQVSVVSLVPPAALVDELQDHGVDVTCLRMRRGVPDPRGIIRLREAIRSRAPQVVHSHLVHANLLARITRPLTKTPVLVCTAHNLIEGRRILELGYRYTDRLADLTTNVSRAAVERYIRVGAAPPERIRFVPNGLDLRQFRPDEAARLRLRRELDLEGFVWLAVGRFEPAKDYPNLLRAFAGVERDPPASLLVVGQGRLERQIRQMAERTGLSKRTRFLGSRNDVPGLMNASDAFVMSSAWEGMPLVLQEASATGLTIVATNVGGNGEVVVDGRSGVLVPPHNPGALSDAMTRVMSMSDGERAEMGRAGRDYVVAQYDIEHVLDLWEQIYRELLTAKALRAESETSSRTSGQLELKEPVRVPRDRLAQ